MSVSKPAKDIKRYDVEWDWDANPFKGKPELQGLKVMAVLLNDWDLKVQNNRVLLVKNETTGNSELHYIVSDWGRRWARPAIQSRIIATARKTMPTRV